MTTNTTAGNGVFVVNGLFDVLVGSNTTLASTVNFTGPLFLEIRVGNETLETLSPRMALNPAPYAFTAHRLSTSTAINETIASLVKSGTGAGDVASISNAGTGLALLVTQTGAASAINVTQPSNNAGIALSKTGNGAGAVLDVTGNSGTGADIKALATFNVTNGAVQAVSYTGLATAPSFIGNGSSLQSLNAGNIVNGTLGDRLSGTYAGAVNLTGTSSTFTGINFTSSATAPGFIGNGSSLASLDATRLVNGTVAGGLLSGSYTGAVNFTGTSSTFTGINFTSSATAPGFIGNGSSLASLDATRLVNGTVAASVIGWTTAYAFNGSSVTSLDATRLVNGTVAGGLLSGSYTGAVNFTGTSSTFTGINFTSSATAPGFIGNGSSLASLDAGNIVNGTLGDRLSGTYAGAVNFTGTSSTFTGINFTSSATAPGFIGNGSSLASLDATRLVNGTVAGGLLSGSYTGAVNFTGTSSTFTGINFTSSATAPGFIGNGSSLASLDATR